MYYYVDYGFVKDNKLFTVMLQEVNSSQVIAYFVYDADAIAYCIWRNKED